MFNKRRCWCTLIGQEVEAIVEETRKGRGAKAERVYTFYTCAHAGRCDRTAFCRFVNPLTTRNPLELMDQQAQKPGVAV